MKKILLLTSFAFTMAAASAQSAKPTEDSVKKVFTLTEQEATILFSVLDFSRKALPTSTAPANAVTEACAAAEQIQKILSAQYQKQMPAPAKKP